MVKKISTIAFLSDTHNRHEIIEKRFGIPQCDIIIHAGDFTMLGYEDEVESFFDWYSALPIPNKVVIAGNHEIFFDPTAIKKYEKGRRFNRIKTLNPRDIVPENITYLENESAVVSGIKMYGSPYQPEFYDWAFNIRRGKSLEACWDLIPDDTELLITHAPPMGHLDVNNRGKNVGCSDLKARIFSLNKLKTHVFGHIHQSRGVDISGGITYINASNLDESYKPVHKPMVFDLFDDGSCKQIEKWTRI
jgi:Icc-related predicted phosphoesterase|tara:strand:+ start:12030 stop:12773 length:744 start_codon:yes stop_codon:yes gene_type:complete